MTLWGKQAEQYNDSEKTPVIAFKGVKVGEYQGMFTPRMLCNGSKVFDAGGRTLSMYSSSTMQVNPEIDECFALRGWYDSAGADQTFKAHSSTSAGGFSSGFNRAEVRGLDEVKQAGYGMPGNPEYFSARGTVMHIKSEPISYPACPNEGCNKKVEEVGDSWRCEKCNQNFSEPQHRYIMSMAVADYSGQAWLQGFNDVGEAVFGMTANELLAIKVSVICFACCATPHLIYMIGSQPRRIHSGNGKVLGVYVQFFLQSQAGYLEGEYFYILGSTSFQRLAGYSPHTLWNLSHRTSGLQGRGECPARLVVLPLGKVDHGFSVPMVPSALVYISGLFSCIILANQIS